MNDFQEELKNVGSFGLSEMNAYNNYKFARHLESKKVHIYRELSKDEINDTKLEKYQEFNNKNLLPLKKEGNLIFLEICNGGTLNYFNNFLSFENYQLDEIHIQNIIKQILNGLECLHKTRKIYNAISLSNIYINFDDEGPAELGNLRCKNYYKEFIKDDSINYTIKMKYFISTTERKKAIISKENDDEKIKYYLAPEILKNLDNDINPIAADMWSLGLITYKLLVGNRSLPFVDDNFEKILYKIKEGKILFPKDICPSFQIVQFIISLLKYKPEERPTFGQIRNHEFLTKKPENFDFMDFELLEKKLNMKVVCNLNEKVPIYKYLIKTTMDDKIDQSMKIEVEEEHLMMRLNIVEAEIKGYKLEEKEWENTKDGEKQREECIQMIKIKQLEREEINQKLEKIKKLKCDKERIE